MRIIFAVYKRELGYYFRSPIAYAVAFALMLLLGLLFSGSVGQAVEFNLQAQQFQQQPITASQLISNVPTVLVFLLFLVAPLITMRLIAEENREGTLEVLMTLPMNESAFIIGKFLAAWTYYTIILLLTLIYYVMLSTISVPDAGQAFTIYLGAWLYGGAVIAVSMIWSAVTEDQIVAAFLGAATVLVLYLTEIGAFWASQQEITAGASDFIREIGLTAHYHSTLLQGIIRAEDIVYFILMIVGALFITTRLVEIRRWRA
ncbi:MAG: ABC transporter permease [Anaerolineae bacterium]|nr:ABC transporter permease [Anaerolineae bacterium]